MSGAPSTEKIKSALHVSKMAMYSAMANASVSHFPKHYISYHVKLLPKFSNTNKQCKYKNCISVVPLSPKVTSGAVQNLRSVYASEQMAFYRFSESYWVVDNFKFFG